MKTLVIAEKPSVARDIARVLGCSKKENGALEGNKYIVTWALGHLVTLKDPEDYDKKYKEWNMAVLPMMPEKLQIKVIPQTGKQYHAVTTQLARKDVNEIVIATDAGREGELVARWILDKAHNQKPCKRLWISSVTDKAIREGFANLKDAKEYDNLYRAAVSRAEADWLVGINATRALTCKYNAQLSCGRVQTPSRSGDGRNAGRFPPGDRRKSKTVSACPAKSRKEEKTERGAAALRSDGAAARCQCTVRLFGKTDPESDAEPL